jgi:uncharacterized protein YuzE
MTSKKRKKDTGLQIVDITFSKNEVKDTREYLDSTLVVDLDERGDIVSVQILTGPVAPKIKVKTIA